MRAIFDIDVPCSYADFSCQTTSGQAYTISSSNNKETIWTTVNLMELANSAVTVGSRCLMSPKCILTPPPPSENETLPPRPKYAIFTSRALLCFFSFKVQCVPVVLLPIKIQFSLFHSSFVFVYILYLYSLLLPKITSTHCTGISTSRYIPQWYGTRVSSQVNWACFQGDTKMQLQSKQR